MAASRGISAKGISIGENNQRNMKPDAGNVIRRNVAVMAYGENGGIG